MGIMGLFHGMGTNLMGQMTSSCVTQSYNMETGPLSHCVFVGHMHFPHFPSFFPINSSPIFKNQESLGLLIVLESYSFQLFNSMGSLFAVYLMYLCRHLLF